MIDETKREEQAQLRSFLDKLEDVRSKVRNMEPPKYLTDQDRKDVENRLAEYDRELGQTIDSFGMTLDKEIWYED